VSCRLVATAPRRPATPRRRRGTRRAWSLPRREVEGICRWMKVTGRRTWSTRCYDFIEFFSLVVRCYAGCRSRRRCGRRRRLFRRQTVALLFSFHCCDCVIRRGTCSTALNTLLSYRRRSCKTSYVHVCARNEILQESQKTFWRRCSRDLFVNFQT